MCVGRNRYSKPGDESEARPTVTLHDSEQLHATSDRHSNMLDQVRRALVDFRLLMPQHPNSNNYEHHHDDSNAADGRPMFLHTNDCMS